MPAPRNRRRAAAPTAAFSSSSAIGGRGTGILGINNSLGSPQRMSASHPIAAELWHCSEMTLRANSGCEQSQQKKLLDHLVGGDKQPRWHGQAERTLGDWSSN